MQSSGFLFMFPRFFLVRWLGGCLSLAVALSFIPALQAQKQDGGTLARVNADRPANSQSYTFAAADKSFGVASAVGSKQATVKSFALGSKVSIYGGDGSFHSKAFTNPKGEGFRTAAFSAKSAQISQRNSFAQGDREFGVKTMNVREAPAANKSAATRDFIPGSQTFYARGKRQDMLDDRTQGAKNLTIDQVRDLLNKGPAGKVGTILEPVFPSIRAE